jgi:hypothetical protein
MGKIFGIKAIEVESELALPDFGQFVTPEHDCGVIVSGDKTFQIPASVMDYEMFTFHPILDGDEITGVKFYGQTNGNIEELS